MAGIPAVVATAWPGHICMALPQKAYQYADNIHRAEQGIALQAMGREHHAELRNRRVERETAREATESDSSGILTPSSSTTSSRSKVSIFKRYLLSLQTLFNSNIRWRKSQGDIQQFNIQQGYNRFTQDDYKKFPAGFPQLAAFMSSDSDFTIFRGFKYCHARVLLQKMVEINELEKDLMELDKRDAADPDMEYRLMKSHQEGWDTTQNDLLKEIELKLKQYDEMYLNFSRMQAFGKPPARNPRSVFNWIMTNKPLAGGYYDFALHSDDFVAGFGQRKSYFQDLIQAHLHHSNNSLVEKLVEIKQENDKTFDRQTKYYSDAWLRTLANALNAIVIFTILLVPVFVLFLVRMSPANMAITSAVAILTFAVTMSIVGGTSDVNVFVGTATYAAVLIVFLGNISGGNVGPLSKTT